jgi:hypothetical protein
MEMLERYDSVKALQVERLVASERELDDASRLVGEDGRGRV